MGRDGQWDVHAGDAGRSGHRHERQPGGGWDLGTFVVAVPLPPTGVDLLAASDTGVSDTDDVTNLDNQVAPPRG